MGGFFHVIIQPFLNDTNTAGYGMVHKTNRYVTASIIKAYFYNNSKQAFPNMKVLSEKDITLDGLAGFEVDCQNTVNGNNYLIKQSYLLTDNYLFEITTSYREGENIDLVTKLDSIVKSVQLVDYSK